jgi:hypothetical protein
MLMLGWLGPDLISAETQRVELRPLHKTPGAIQFSLVYTVDGATPLTTGMGIRIHYNSGAVSELVLSDVFHQGLIVKDPKPKPDLADHDRNPETDLFIVLAWMDIDGRWPHDAALPLTLATVSVVQSPSKDPLRLAVSATSVPAGFSFRGGRT